MKNTIAIMLVLASLLVLPGLSWSAEVAQGRCLSYDQEKHQITIEEYDTNFSEEYPYGQPTGIESTFDVENAKVGISPEEGDVLRIAYLLEGPDRKAIKVMNVSKQDLMRK